MVGSSITDEERSVASARLKAGFVLLVGVSGGLVSLQGDPTPVQALGATVGGLLVGYLLMLFLARSARGLNPRR